MKPTNNNVLQIIAIYADDKKGLLGQILMLFNRKDYPVHSLSVARTDIQDFVLITLEVYLPEKEIHSMLMRLDKIIEVYKAEAYKPGETDNPKVGMYRLAIEALNNSIWILLQKSGATVCGLDGEAFLIRKIGTEDDLKLLYNQLEGPWLLDFCQSSLVAPDMLLKAEKYLNLNS